MEPPSKINAHYVTKNECETHNSSCKESFINMLQLRKVSSATFIIEAVFREEEIRFIFNIMRTVSVVLAFGGAMNALFWKSYTSSKT